MEPTSRIRNWLKGVDRWLVFEPARWPHRELISRAMALLIVIGFVALRIYRFDHFPQTLDAARSFYSGFRTADGQFVYTSGQIAALWGTRFAVWMIETAIYLGYIASYASRARARSIAAGFMQTAFPVTVAGIPILLSFMPYSLPRWAPFSSPAHLYYYLGIMALIVVGGTINLIGLLTLRRAFTIMSEARELVTRGIFSRIRHPLYTGHFIMFLGSLLLRLHPAAVLMYLLFCIGQVIRAGIEERKLTAAFPAYADYQKRTGMFFPRRIRGRKQPS
jgi:protein-S-isoprenylcysteine O-methyltransferase Ste14